MTKREKEMKNSLKAAAALAALVITAPALASPSPKPLATIFKNPQCGCCETYARYLQTNGYQVKLVATHDLPLIQKRQGVPAGLEGCHTTLVGGYFVDGHVPIGTFNRLLSEKPDISGITLPGMPTGSPGMGGPKSQPFTIYAVAPGKAPSVYAVE